MLFGAGDGAEADDLGPALPRARRIGVCHAGWIDIATIGFPHDAADTVEIHQRMQAFGLIPADLMEIHAIKLGLGRLQAQLMFALFGLGEIERSGLEDTAALPGFGLELFVEVHRVVLDAADIGAVMQPVNIRGRMPGGPGGQLIALEQNHIGPAQFG